MRKKLAYIALALGAVVAFVLALPGGGVAKADTTGTAITQDMLNETNLYEITEKGTYYLSSESDTMYGSIQISRAAGTGVVLDLNGKTLIGSDSRSAIILEARSATLQNGNVIQSAQSQQYAIAVTSVNGNIQIKNVNASSTDQTCLQIGQGYVRATDCSFKSTNSTTTPAGAVTFTYGSGSVSGFYATNCDFSQSGEGAVITDGNIGERKDVDSTPELVSGTLTGFPVMSEGDGKYHITAKLSDSTNNCLQYLNGTYTIISRSDVSDSVMYRIDDVDGFGTVYFDSKDEAYDVAGKIGKDVVAKCKVTFETKRGTAPAAQYCWPGDKTTAPETPTCDKYLCTGWLTEDGTVFDFDNTAITKDTTLTAKWIPNPAVAEVVRDGKVVEQFATVQEAVDLSEAGDTVNLLMDTTEFVTVGEGKDFTLDLCGHTLTMPSGADYDHDSGALNLEADAKVVVTNGSVNGPERKFKQAGIFVAEDSTVELTLSNVTMSGWYAPLYAKSGKIVLSGDDNKLECTQRVDYAMYLMGTADVTVEGGTFTAGGYDTKSESDEYGCVCVGDQASLSIADGTFDDRVVVQGMAELTISGGYFARPDNASDVVDGKVFYMPETAEYYEVVETQFAHENARWVVTNADDDPASKVYTYLKDPAEAYFVRLSGESTIHKMHKVQVVEDGTVLKTEYLESVADKYGELPEAKQVSGYTFAGWYVGTDKVTSTDSPTDELDYDVTVVAKWTENVKPEDKTSKGVTPTEHPTTRSALPKTGDVASVAAVVATAGASVAGIGIYRRRK